MSEEVEQEVVTSQEFENIKFQLQLMQDQIENLTLSLEIANERWIKAVNENMQIEIELRKSKKGN